MVPPPDLQKNRIQILDFRASSTCQKNFLGLHHSFSIKCLFLYPFHFFDVLKGAI
jgi:hypothetical protein